MSCPSELIARSALIIDVCPVRIAFGLADAPRTSQGSKSNRPEAVSQGSNSLFGPSLQPHQLFSAATVPTPGLFTPNWFATIRLKWIPTPAPFTSRPVLLSVNVF